MIDPWALRSKTIIFCESQEEWDELQAAAASRGAKHYEKHFDKVRPYRWIDSSDGDEIEWYKGTSESAESQSYRSWEKLHFSDLPQISAEIDEAQVSSLLDLV